MKTQDTDKLIKRLVVGSTLLYYHAYARAREVLLLSSCHGHRHTNNQIQEIKRW